MGSRNLEKNGVLINIYFFCRALGIPKPERISDPVPFMESLVSERNLDWSEIAEKVRVYRDSYKNKRRLNHHRKAEEYKKAELEFFAVHNKASPKQRNCLRCDTVFLSKVGDRMCGKCNYVINNFLGPEGAE